MLGVLGGNADLGVTAAAAAEAEEGIPLLPTLKYNPEPLRIGLSIGGGV